MRKAAWMLVLCCLLWGYSFPVMQKAMTLLEAHFLNQPAAPAQILPINEIGLRAAFLGWRFALAAIGTMLLWPAARKAYSRYEFKTGAVLGVMLTLGMAGQIGGLRYTLPSVSSFITSLSVVFTPLAQAVFFRRPVSSLTWLGVVLALIGMTILAQPNPGACADCQVLPIPPFPYLGEILTTLGALFFTGLILGLDVAGPKCNPARMSVAVFSFAALFTSLIGVSLCGSSLYNVSLIKTLVSDHKFLLLLFSLTLFSSVLAISLMYRYQRFVSPAVASVIYTTESVFATGFSLLFQAEQLTYNTVLGGTLILGALILVTIPRKPKSGSIVTPSESNVTTTNPVESQR